MATNKILKSVNTQLSHNPSVADSEEALKALQEYIKTRKTIELIFTESCREPRWQQVDQYFQIRRLLEVFKITFPKTRTDDQAVATKYFNLEWQGDRTARLYWSVGQGWTIEHKQFDRELTGVWEDFNFEETLLDNQLYFE